jgi:Domain of unknown function DUF29
MNALKDPVKSLYEQDFAAWAFDQAEAVRRGDWRALDVPNLIEELESIGRQQRAEIRNRLIVLLMHLAKWEHQPAQRGNSWRSSINTQRGEIPGYIEDSPSLKPYIPEAMQKAWKVARVKATDETGLPEKTFPEQCPYSFEQALNWDWLPE